MRALTKNAKENDVTFVEGQRLEFQLESWDWRWFDGVYVTAIHDMPGWHYVRRNGFGNDRFTIPTRRIRVRV
jgi:hypothetical protein